VRAWRAGAIAIAGTLAGAAACGPRSGQGGDVIDGGGGSGTIDTGGTPADTFVVPPFADAGPGCSVLPVKVRDFHKTHPDFEHFTSDAVTTGLVQATLGADKTPTYAPAGATICTTGPTQFHDWYHDVADVNVAIASQISLIETAPGTYVYDNAAFFPIDNQGFGNEGFDHNFSFTTEIHTAFRYQGGESFTFRGDDDLWLFINGRLAIDLGGLHQPAQATIDLDAQAGALGLTVGQTYPMDVFQAERHTLASNFRIETTIDCFVIP
jgi:fibro-slime domain-containing protein